MRYLGGIVLLASVIAVIIIFAGMAAYGIRCGRIATESSRPPIHFDERPIAFVGLTLFYLAAAGLSAVTLFRILFQVLDGP